MSPYIPAEVLRQVISASGDSATNIALRAGMHPNGISKLLTGSKPITASMADRIVTVGLGDPGLWFREPLSDFYGVEP